MKISYETIKYDDNLPARIELSEALGSYFKKETHWHKEIELIYIAEGGLTVTKNGETYALESGRTFLMNSGEIHRIDAADAQNRVRCLSVYISYDFAKRFYSQFDGIYFAVEPGTEAQREIDDIMRQLILTKTDVSDDFSPLVSFALLSKLLHILFEKCRRQKQISLYGNCKVNFRNAKIVMEYAEEHYRENLTTAGMAALVGLSPTYFSNYFKKTTGTGFAVFLNNVRLRHAVDDLIENGLTVTEAAEHNGFTDASAFVNICKRGYGMTPMQLKRSRLQAV